MAFGGLGNGLEMLFADNSTEVQTKKTLRVSELEPNRTQPRKNFDESAISSLAESIQQHGVLQPILVRPLPGSGYQIIAGERRWRAARMIGLDEVPVIIKELSDLETAQIALIENLQREDLNPVEEALAFRRLQDDFGMRQEDISKIVGRSRSAVANSLRLLRLPEQVLELLEDGSISAGHARALLAFTDEEEMIRAAQKAAAGLLTVRQLEKMSGESGEKPKAAKSRDSYFDEMEISLHDRLGRKVKVDYKKNKGVLMLEFYDKDDLQELARMLTES